METKKDKIKFRRNWGSVNPVTKIKDSDKQYHRAQIKRELYKNLEQLEDYDEDII